ncbi:MAG: hypothetical protein QXR38_03260, partial [Nitrososphaerales archaeon]
NPSMFVRKRTARWILGVYQKHLSPSLNDVRLWLGFGFKACLQLRLIGLSLMKPKYVFMASLGGFGTLMDYANSLWLNGFSIRLRKLRLENGVRLVYTDKPS